MKTIALITNIVWCFIFFPTASFALISPMMMDAPGSEENKLLWLALAAVVILPLLILASQVFAWMKYSNGNYSLSIKIALIPLIDILFLIILFAINGNDF